LDARRHNTQVFAGWFDCEAAAVAFNVAACTGTARLANSDTSIDVLPIHDLKAEGDVEMARRLRRAPSIAWITEKETRHGLARMG
jgi:hypothetical protein